MPKLIYGCMGLGGGWDDEPFRPSDIEKAEAAIAAALEIGIDTLDLADIYRRGKSEAVVGEVLARAPEIRQRICIQTKCGIRLPADGRPGLYDLRRASILQRVEESLARLKTDRIDRLLLHRPDPLADLEEVAGAVDSLHREGLVGEFGVSNMSATQIAFMQGAVRQPLVVNQLQLSLGHRGFVESSVMINAGHAATASFPDGTLEYCREHGLELQAWSPLAQGRYSGGQQTPEETKTAVKVTALAASKETTEETIVLWWLQRHPARITPVIGTTRPERIRACGDAQRREPDLSYEEWYGLWIAARGGPLP